jgi:uncharacterized repeat protein (TIGR01451 family)
MRKLPIYLFSLAAAAGGAAACLHLAPPEWWSGEAGEGEEDPPKSDDWIARYTYPTGHFDPTWAAEAAVQDRAMVKAVPAGAKTYDKSLVPHSPLTLDASRFTPLGPMPENNTQQSYGSVSGRINVIAVDPVDPTIAYAGSDGGGIWKTTTCCSLDAPPNNPTTWQVVTNIPEIAGLSISDITLDPNDHKTIYAATGDLNFGNFSFGASGVLKSTDQGATWRLLGTDVFSPYYAPIDGGFPQYQAIGKVVVDPNNSRTVVVGTKTSVYFSYDAGENWVGPCYVNEFATSANRQRQDVTGLIPVSNGDGSTRLYVAIGTRGNATPTQPDIGQNGANGVYRLERIPGGGCPATSAWSLLNNGWPAGTGSGNPTGTAGGTDIGRIELAVSPSQPDTIYAMAASVSGSNVLGVWRSDNRGDTWVQKAATANVARCGSDSTSAGGGTQMWYDAGISVHPSNPEITFLSGFDVYRSTDGGANYADITCGWTTKPAGTLDHVHVDQHARAFLPGNGEKMLIGNDGGVYYTENSTAPFPSFRQLNDTLNTIEFYFGDITSNFANSATPAIGAGAQDNGCSAVKFDGQPTGPVKWTSNCSGDGTTTKIEPIGNAIWFNSSQYGSLARSLTYGNTMSGSFSTASGNTGGTWGGTGDLSSTIFAMSYDIYKWGALDVPGSGCSTANGCNHMLAGTNRLWETLDLGNSNTTTMRASWKARTPNLTKNSLILGASNRSYINHVAYSFTDPTVAAVGTNDGNVQIVFGLGTVASANCPMTPSSDPNCANAVNVTDNNNVLPNRPIFGVRFDPRSALVAYAAVGGFDQNTPGRPGHVFQVTCSAYNCPSFTWKDKSGNLPNIPVEQVMPNPNNPDQVFIGTDWGLYYTDDISVDSPTWHYFEDFPRVMVWDLVVDRGFTTLAAFTRSRGAWVWPLPNAAIGSGADLAVSQTGSATVGAGGQATYVVTVTNNGPNTANDVVLKNPMPAGVILGSISGDCSAFPCTFASLGASASRTVTVTYTVPPGYDTNQPLVNTASVSSSTEDPNPGNNSATVTTPVTSAADLALAMTGPANLNAAGSVSYTITLTNNGPSPAQAVSVADATPAGLTFVSNSGDCTTAFPCTFASLAAGATRTIVATFSVPDGYAQANIVNTASVSSSTSDPVPGNNSASATTTFTNSADLALAMTGPSSAGAAGNVTYTITLTNNGPSPAKTISVADATPAGLTFVSNTGDCTGAFPCTFASLASGATRTIVATFAVPDGYAQPNVVNSASVSSATPDPVPANNSASVTTAISHAADLMLTMQAPAGVVRGGTVTYTIAVTNKGPGGASTVSVADATPAGLVFVSNAGDCVTAFPCSLGTLANGAVKIINATFRVPYDYAGAGPVANTATVSSSTTDPVPGNNSASVNVALTDSADVSITQAGTAAVLAGDSVSYTVTVANAGPSAAAAVSVTNATPAGLVLGTVSGACTSLPCNLGTLAPGANRSYVVTYTVPSNYAGANPITHSASVGSSTPDPDMNNNVFAAHTTVGAGADIAVAIAAPEHVLRGGRFSYTVSVTNNGPSTAQNVQLSHVLPAGLVFVGNAGDCSSAWPCAFPSLAAGVTRSVTTTVCVPRSSGGSLARLDASGSSATTDPYTGNNSAAAYVVFDTDALFRDGFELDCQ